jgi:hypothetical protein
METTHIYCLPREILIMIASDYLTALDRTVFSYVDKSMNDIVRGKTLLPGAVCGAATANISVLKWTVSAGYPCAATTCAAAACCGNLDSLKWLREIGCPWNNDTLMGAAEFGHLEVLKYALNEGCHAILGDRPPWYQLWVYKATRYGYLHILKWYFDDVYKLSSGERISYVLSELAAHNGHLHILQWFHKIGTPPAMEVCMQAMVSGQLDILKWATSLGALVCPGVCLGMHFANKECCDWIRENCYD